MSAAALPAGAAALPRSGARAARAPVALVRAAAFLLLAGFGARAWVRMVDPAAGGALSGWLLAAAAVAVALVAVARRGLGRGARAGATALAAGALLLVALRAAGVPGDLLAPRMWDELAAGVSHGLATVPNVRVPYHGADEWTRNVIVLGGGALVGLAALLAFAPRRGGAFGFPLLAAVPLATLYLVPVVQHDAPNQFWAGGLFALLLAAFLWLERVERRAAPMAASVVAAALVAGLVLAPGLDRASPLLDYEGLALTLSSAGSERYDWNHAYAPLQAREGREVLRVEAQRRAYWKAANLATFDGTRWLVGGELPGSALDDTLAAANTKWVQRMRITFRGLTSSQFVGAGRTLLIDRSPRDAVESGPGVFETLGRPLRRGNAYRTIVYAPQPTERELRAASRTPLPVATVGSGQTAVYLPAARGSSGPRSRILVPAWGDGELGAGDVAALESSSYARVWELSRRLRSGAATPYAYMRSIERHLAAGYAYSEDPRRSTVPLEDFLLHERAGYCQQFSGAMALLLRLGGVPARVAAGFSPGSYDRERREYVVRDMDAHSWVEVFFPGIGWVTRDPTPGDAPARSQTTDVGITGPGLVTPLRDAPAQTPAQAGPGEPLGPAASAAEDGGSSLPVALALVALAALGAALWLAVARGRRRGRPAESAGAGAGELAELRRALRRSGREPTPQTTLQTLARRWRDTPAEGYVRALADARFGYGDGRPSPAQRAAVRRELAAGLGLRGRLRAWWALPPRVARR